MTDLPTLLHAVTAWAAGRPDVKAVLLVGSHARGCARPDSDVDLVVLADAPQTYLGDPGVAGFLGPAARSRLERWGRATSVRTWLRDGPEVELTFATPDWILERPLDPGTARVLRDGAEVVLDRLGGLREIVAAARRGG